MHEKWNVAKTCEMKCTVFGLGVDETPGDTVSHSDGSRLIAGNTLKRFTQASDLSAPQSLALTLFELKPLL